MGQSQSCNNLNEFGNVCQIHNCIERVVGLDSNSSSPTDTWILTFKSGTKYENNIIKKGFVKFFIDPSTLPADYTGINNLEGLGYEIQVYRDIIRPLVDLKICPNFIKYLGSGKSCSYESMIKILDGSTYIENSNRLKENHELVESFQDNFNHMFELSEGRESINTSMRGLHGTEFAQDYKYDLLVNETISSDAINFQDYLIARPDINQSPSPLNEQDWCIIFQIIIGCYSMSLSKMSHNDLHHENVYIEPYSEPLNYVIGTNSNVYRVKCGHIIKIYDFDRSYCERLGINVMLREDDWLESYSQSNDFIPNRDMLKIFGYIYEAVDENDKRTIEKIVSKPDNYDFLRRVYETDMFLGDPDSDGKALVAEDYETRFNTAEQILKNVASFSKTEVTDEKDIIDILVDTNNLYTCIPQYFNIDGKITGHSASEQFSYYKQKELGSNKNKGSNFRMQIDNVIKNKDDIIAKLDEEIRRLKDENKELKDDMNNLKEQISRIFK